MNLDQFAKDLETLQRRHRHEERSRPWAPSMTPATGLGYRCIRRSVYQQVNPNDANPISEELASIFTEGKEHEKQVRRELSELGFEVLEAERNFKDIALQISGTIDGKLAVPDLNQRKGFRAVPAEIKSWSGTAPIDEAAMRADDGLVGRYYAQGQVYMFLDSIDEMLFVFKSKLTGLWRVIPAHLDYGYAEELLKRAEIIRDSVISVRAGGVLPDRLADRSECKSCPWRETLCHPEEADIDPTLLATDAELEADLAERELLDEPRKLYAKLDKRIKDRFKMTAGDRFVCGDFIITKRPHGKGIRIDIKRAELAAGEAA